MKKSMGILLSLLLALSISDAGVAEKKNAFDFCNDFSARLALFQTVILETPDIVHSGQEYAIVPLTDYSAEKERYLCKLPAANIVVSMPNFEIEEASCLIIELDTPQSETTAAVSGSAMVYSALEYGNSPNSLALIHQTYNEFTSAVSKCIKSVDNQRILEKENGTRISFLSGNYAYSLYTNRVNENGKTKHCLFMEATANPAHASRSETGFKSQFGQMEPDMDALYEDLYQTSEKYRSEYAEVDACEAALNTAVESYTTASVALSRDLLTYAITGAELTEEQIQHLYALGDAMGTALIDGIDASLDGDVAYLAAISGGLEEAVSNPVFQNEILSMAEMKEYLINDIKVLDKELRTKLNNAVSDSIVTGDERSAIMETVSAYDKVLADVAK